MVSTRPLLTLLTLSLAFGCASSQPTPDEAPPPPTSVDEVAARAAQALRASPPEPRAIVIGIVAEGTRQVFSFGEVNGVPPEDTTLFPLGTASEPLFATLLATYVAEGELDYDQPVGSITCDATLVTSFCYRGSATTYRHLVQHASSLPRLPDEIDDDGFGHDDLGDLLAGFEPSVTPGARFRQSAVGYGALGMIMERRFGVAPITALEERVLVPLGLESTTFQLDAVQTAPGYHDGAESDRPDTRGVLLYSRGAASNAVDLMAFVEAQMIPESRPGLADAIRLTQRVSEEVKVSGDSRAANGWFWHATDDVYWHNGVSEGHRSFIGFDPESDIGVVLLTNEAGASVDEVGLEMLRQIGGIQAGIGADE